MFRECGVSVNTPEIRISSKTGGAMAYGVDVLSDREISRSPALGHDLPKAAFTLGVLR